MPAGASRTTVFIIAGLALLLFAALAALRFVLTPREHGALSPDAAYDTLALALENAGLGLYSPLAGAKQVLRRNADPTANIAEASGPRGEPQLALGEVLHFTYGKDALLRIELDPQQWRQLAAGPLRDAVADVSRIPLKRQAGSELGGGGMEVQRTNFSFSTLIGVQTWVMTPFFAGEQCNLIVIVPSMEDDTAGSPASPLGGLQNAAGRMGHDESP